MNYLQALLVFLWWSDAGERLCIDPCSDAKAGRENATMLIRDTVFITALKNIQAAFKTDGKEHALSFGRDQNNEIFSSAISNGTNSNGTVPFVAHAFADLHTHPNDIPPDAGDLYGLIDINKNNPGYNTRFVITVSGTLYALLITDTAAAKTFNEKYPRQLPAHKNVQPALPSVLVDESREIKYRYHVTDEMVMAFILEKYNTGVCLLKQNDKGEFKKLRTLVTERDGNRIFIADNCP